MKKLIALGLALLPLAPAAAEEPRPLLLGGLYQSRAVLQRDRPIVIRGQALPGESVTVTLGPNRAAAKAAADGAWKVTLPAMPAGGPYSLTAATPSGARQRLEDLLIGDVWLCSGQSNMELQVERALDTWSELNQPGDPQIRLLTVQKDAQPVPLAEFAQPVSWQPARPDTFRNFSAACYFMGRELRRSEQVPIGLINASWGGTAIDAWRSEQAVAADPNAGERFAIWKAFRRDPAEGNRLWGEVWESWWLKSRSDRPWQPASPGAWKPVPSFAPFETWGDPATADLNGVVFYRATVTLTAAQAAKPAAVSLGFTDDLDQSWVNGRAVGNSSGWGINREYRLPSGLLEAGENTVVVAVLDTYGNGGMTGPDTLRQLRFDDGESVPLTGWHYRFGARDTSQPRAPWEQTSGFTGIYNGMIAPLGDYGLRGVAWYQGESDAGNAKGYAGKLLSMMADWRRQFDNPRLPFLIVQLAGWGPYAAAPQETGFAQVREEQRLAVRQDGNAALAVAIDLGNARDIHPADKQEVARRLARAARALTYGGKLSPSGPEPIAAKRAGDAVTIDFSGVEGSLVSYSGAPLGFELCDANGCRFVSATINGTSAMLPATAADTRVRFCWGDTPVCNVYDKSGVPMGPFELAVQ